MNRSKSRIVFFVLPLTFGAFAGMAQTLTCTFQFTASGTLGTQRFTNAAVTITTIGDTSNRQTSSGPGEYYINNTSASISISGVGSFQFATPPPTGAFLSPSNPAPGATVSEYFTFGSRFGLSTALLFGIRSTTDPWSMLSSIGPVSLASGSIISWSTSPIVTNGGTVNLYDTSNSIPMTFQAVLTGGTPGSVLSRWGVFSHLATDGVWDSTINLINTSSTPASATVNFHADDGTALTLPLSVRQQGSGQTTTANSLNITVNPNSTVVIATIPNPSKSSVGGWADVLASGPLNGFEIFRSTSEATVPFQTAFPSSVILPYDNTNGYVMGVALANLATQSATINVTVWDEGGNQLAVQSMFLAGSGHTAFMLADQIPVTAGKRGIIQFKNFGGGGVSGLGLRASPAGPFTDVPVVLPQ